MNGSRWRLPLILAAGMAAVSSASILIKFARAEQVPPLVIAAVRLTLASAVLLPLAWHQARDELLSLTRREAFWAFVSGVFLALHFAFWISSLDYTSVMSSVVFVATNPLFVALASLLLLRERLGRAVWIGILVAVGGGVIIGSADLGASQGVLSGDLLALAGAVAASAYVLIGRKLRGTLSLVAYVGLVYSVAAVGLLLLALASGASFVGYSATGYVYLLLLALLPQLIGHTSFNYALKFLSAALVSVILLAEPVGATLLAVPLLGQVPSPVKLLGGALVLGGIVIAARGNGGTVENAARVLPVEEGETPAIQEGNAP